MTKQTWVIKRNDDKYVDESGSDYTDDLLQAFRYSTKSSAQSEVDANSWPEDEEQVVEVRISIEEVA